MTLAQSLCLFTATLLPFLTSAETPSEHTPNEHSTEKHSSNEQCLIDALAKAGENETVAALKTKCSTIETQTVKPSEKDALSERIQNERETEQTPFVLTPHRMNYILPVQSTSGINREAYLESDNWEDNLKDIETKYQLSLKIPLHTGDLLLEGDGLYFAFTVEAWWQTYAEEISRPFRETNYRPELFYLMPMPYEPFGHKMDIMIGVEHQSNGRDQRLSRSWNRAFLNLIFEDENSIYYVRPWWRFPEDEDEFPGDPSGDDNPDISAYMGHFQAGSAHRWEHSKFGKLETSFMFRQNFNTGKGAIKVGFTFPLWGKLRGYAEVFNGYGESLIDYNHSQTRIGIGFALNDIL